MFVHSWWKQLRCSARIRMLWWSFKASSPSCKTSCL